jgi:hypothetical protein
MTQLSLLDTPPPDPRYYDVGGLAYLAGVYTYDDLPDCVRDVLERRIARHPNLKEDAYRSDSVNRYAWHVWCYAHRPDLTRIRKEDLEHWYSHRDDESLDLTMIEEVMK